MRRHGTWSGLAILLALMVDTARAQEPEFCEQPAAVSIEAPESDVCVSNCGPVRYAPTMFGDFLAVAVAPALGQVQALPGSSAYPFPVPRGAFKIAENESPRPQNRVFINYNYYNQVLGPVALTNVHRETFGFEKTLFEGRGSIGIRQPFYQVEGGIRDTDLDDVSGIFKLALYDNQNRGILVSSGMVVTAPSSQNATIILPTGEQVHPVLLQPFLGYSFTRQGFYLHGFSAVMVPTHSKDVTIAFNDVGIGYTLFRGRPGGLLTAVLPTVEAHINTPLTERDITAPLQYQDIVDLTAGANVILKERSSLGMAVAIPVVGHRPFNLEVLVNFNWRF